MFKLNCLLTGVDINIPENLFEDLKYEKEKFFKRRSRLYIPLINERYIQKSISLVTDGLIFDLEDSIPLKHKLTARDNIVKIPPKKDDVEYILRINGYETGLWEDDINALNTYPFDSVMIPKVESAKQIEVISNQLSTFKVKRIVLIETIQGLWNVREIVDVLNHGDAIGYGAGDLSTSFGISRAPIYESCIIQQALIQVLMAAKNSDIDVFDPPYRDYSDLLSLQKEAEFCRKFGTRGKQAIHPSQIEVINRVYSPSDTEIASYIAELLEFENNPERQAISLNSKKYIGKPSKILAKKKLIDFLNRGYIDVEHIEASQDTCVELQG